MNDRTRKYVRGRFKDYYRQQDPHYPPKANEREWAFIPWTDGDNTVMVRHKTSLDLGDLGEFLGRRAPRHMYFSAGKYNHPGRETSMAAKERTSSDLIFDLDADHFPEVDPETTSLETMLDICKDSLKQLLAFIENDFGFRDTQIVFSGNRGYHLHVRDDGIQTLNSDERREIADYVQANGLDISGLITRHPGEAVNSRRIRNKGGWGKHIHAEFVDWCLDLGEMDHDSALTTITDYEQIAEGRAETFLSAIENNPKAIKAGNIEIGGKAMRIIFKQFAEEVSKEYAVPIDEPVTTDTRRLIRLPKSIHGGSGLVVTPLDKSDLNDFEPLRDAIPDRFTDQEITIEIDEPQSGYLNGSEYNLQPGEHTVPEHVGIHLMTAGNARKLSEF